MSTPETTVLSNGIPVILQNHPGKVATLYWWISVGSADEEPQQAGFAHFLEHMLFKDSAAKETGKPSTGKMARAIESLGGEINAYTSFDQTVYHVTCAAHHWEKVLDVFGQMAKPQVFLKEDFEREREVILEELRKNEDSPGRQLFQSLFSTTFAQHPYGKPVIGFVETLKAATVSELEKFYRGHYVSSQMGLILVGPLGLPEEGRRQNLLKKVERLFGASVLKPQKAQSFARPIEPVSRETSTWAVKPFDVKTPILACSFRVPELAHEDLPALDILGGILGTGELSRLYQRLFYQTSLVTSISGGLYSAQDPGMLYFQAEMDSVDRIQATFEEFLKETRKLIDDGPLPEELARVLVNAESERLYATQTVDGMAGRLGFLQFIMGNLGFDHTYLEALRKVDCATVQKIAKKYLTHLRFNGVILLPIAEKLPMDCSVLKDLAAQWLPAPQRASVPWTEGLNQTESSQSKGFLLSKDCAPGDVQRFVMPSGLQFCFQYRPASPVFSIHASALGGLRFEIAHPLSQTESDWGSSHMMSLTWTQGTSKRDARAIAHAIEGHAASMEGFSGRNSIGLQLTALCRDWDLLSELFTEVYVDPLFPEDEVEHSRRVVEEDIRSVKDHSSQRCSQLFLENLYEQHPYGKMLHGSLESLKLIDSKKLRAFHRAWIRPERGVISVSGGIDPRSCEAWAHRLDEQLRQLVALTPSRSIPRSLNAEPPLRADRWIYEDLGREQCHILVGGLGTTMDAADRNDIRLLQNILGGQSGRLFIELREKKSLAYTVAPVSFEGLEKGYVGTYIACAPSKKEEAIRGIRSVLEKFATRGPTAVEMKRAQEYFLGRRAMDLQSDLALASHVGLEALYGLPWVDDAAWVKKVHQITPKRLQKVCTSYWVEPFGVTSIVG